MKKDNFIIRNFRVSDLNSIKRIIKKLYPEWFTEEALEIEQLRKSIASLPPEDKNFLFGFAANASQFSPFSTR